MVVEITCTVYNDSTLVMEQIGNREMVIRLSCSLSVDEVNVSYYLGLLHLWPRTYFPVCTTNFETTPGRSVNYMYAYSLEISSYEEPLALKSALKLSSYQFISLRSNS